MQTRVAALALGLLGLLALLVSWRLEPPPAAPVEAPGDEFSAARAQATLVRLLGAELPHPTGTPEQEGVRERLVAELTTLHLAPELQRGTACDDRLGVCAEVVNVVAIVPGKSDVVRLGLIAHYDSVAAGPGAADDGQGTATLVEIARALAAEPADESIALVLTDGEELGLLGARLFVREHPLMRKLETVINVEARGSRGPSLMFQTTPGSAWLVELFARTAQHPVTSSLFPAVYRALPNDTDFTIFTERGVQGLNFAFIGGVESYHTPRDSVGALDLRSVQQQGANVLGLARAIAAHGGERPGAESIFFDVLSLFVVRLRMPWFWCLAVVSSTVLGACTLFTLQRHVHYARALPRALGRVLVGLALPCLASWLVTLLLGWLGALPFPFVATPAPLLCSLVLFAFAGQAWSQSGAQSAAARLASWDATWLVWLALGWLLLALVAGASYVIWVPAFAAALVRPFISPPSFGGDETTDDAEPPRALSYLAPVILTTLLIVLPPASMLYDAIGFSAPPALSFVFSMALQPAAFALAPLLANARSTLVLGALGFVAGLAQCLPPASSSRVPQRLPLALSVDPDGRAEWLADTAFGPLPKDLAHAAEWQGPSADAHPWPGFGRRRVHRAAADARSPSALEPVLSSIAASRFELELTLPPSAWAATVHLRAPRALTSASFRGQAVQARAEGAWHSITLVPGDERRVTLSLVFEGAALPEIEVSELTRGLPPDAAHLVGARGDAAITSQLGDVTLKRLQVQPPGE